MKFPYLFLSILLIAIFSCKKDPVSPEELVTEVVDTLPKEVPEKIVTDTIVVPEGQTSPFIDSGFYGYVIWKEGDHMPRDASDTTSSWGITKYVQMDVYVYNALTFDSVKSARTEEFSWFWFVDKVRYTPLFVVRPNSDGYYEVPLGKGSYTGFVKVDEERFYCKNAGRKGHLGPMLFDGQARVRTDFIVDYMASY
jgi:hypothetical protein